MNKGYDICEVFDHYGVDYRSNGSGNIQFICPFHNDTNFGNANWNEEKQIYKCFSCNAGGNIFKFVVEMEGGEDKCSYRHAEKLIASNFTYTGGYDTNVLEKMLEQFKRKQGKNKNELLNKSIDNILIRMSAGKLDIIMFTKWLRIITYISYYSNVNLSKQETLAIVNLYTDFFKEANNV